MKCIEFFSRCKMFIRGIFLINIFSCLKEIVHAPSPAININSDSRVISKVLRHNSNHPAEARNFNKVLRLPDNTTSVIVSSSMPRSGSSFLGELMTVPNPSSFYFFEPLSTMDELTLTKKKYLQMIKAMFACDFSTLNFTGPKNIYNVLRHPSVARCRSDRGPSCKMPTTEHMEHLCKKTKLRVIKTIRIPLNFLEDLINDPEENVKVIHLVRDPRASLLSANKLDFKLNQKLVCDKTLQVGYFEWLIYINNTVMNCK